MELSSLEISRLVHHHLLKQGYVNTANTLITECNDLFSVKPAQAPDKIPRIVGPSLVRIINAYHEAKDLMIDELELLKSTAFTYEDSVPSLFKCYKLLKSVSPKETHDKSVNTEDVELCLTKKTCDVETNTEEVAATNHVVSSEEVTQLATTNQVCNHNGNGEEPNQSGDIPSESDQSSYNGLADTVDFSMMYDRLLEAGDLHEKIAESINKKKGSSPQKESPSNDGFTQHFDSIVRAIVAETQADPAFESIIQECIGIDSDLSSAETPSSVDHNTDVELHMPSSSYADQSKMNPEFTAFDGQALQCAAVPQSGFMMPNMLQPAQNSTIITGSSMMNSLNTFTIVTGADGQIALVPATFAAVTSTPLPVEANKPKGKRKSAKAPQEKAPKPPKPPKPPKLPKPSTAVVPVVRPRTTPMPILPKPIIINLEEITSKVDAAVTEALSGCSLQEAVPDAAPPVENDKVVAKIPSRQPKMLRTTRLLSQRARKPQYRRVHPIPAVPCSPKPQSSPAKLQNNRLTQPLLDLCSIARGLCQSIALSGSVSEQEGASVEVQKSSTPTTDSAAFVSTPTSTRRRSSHVRQLNFGESPDTPTTASSPKVRRSTRLSSDIPWDSALRGISIATVESDQQPAASAPVETETGVSVFATPKGKAKRARKSPLFRQPDTVDSTATDEPAAVASPVNETDQPEATSNDATMFSVPEQVQPNSPSLMQQMFPNLMANSETSDADLVAASILSEMANTPYKEVDPKVLTTEVAAASSTNSLPNLPNFGREFAMQAPSAFPLQPSMPMLSTPRKALTIEPGRGSGFKNNVMFDPHTSSSFGTWDGEIPKTPQIQTDLTSSSSPFLVSLTKGFRFLPAADSPSLAVPSTPSIGGESHSNSNSLQTPYTGFYQFPSILNTPRVEALRQELMESPGKNSTTTMISPTQVVLGRSAPYFVPSGERSQGPFFNQSATPEHIPETDKLERRRRSCSTEMEPLQLEESNDASDEAADLLRQAAANAAAALQPPTPYKTDQRLESDLINECQRLEVPSVETTNLRKERMVELFGEETTTLSEAQQPPSEAVPVPIANENEPLEEGTSKKRTTKSRKSKKVDPSATNGSCARFQDYHSSSYFAERIAKRLSNPSSASNEEFSPPAVGGPKSAHDERIIQEILASHGIKSSLTPSSFNSKRKRKSVESTSACRDSSDISPAQKKSRRSKKTASDSPQPSTSNAPPSEPSLHSSRDETDGVDVDVMELDASTTSTEGSSKKNQSIDKITKTKRVQPLRVNKPNISVSKSAKSPSKNKTPVKLFNKSLSSSGVKVNLQRHRAASHHASFPTTAATDTLLTSSTTLVVQDDDVSSLSGEPEENLPNPDFNGDVDYSVEESIQMNEEEPPSEAVTESVPESNLSTAVISGEKTESPEPNGLVHERSYDDHREEEESFSTPSLAVDPPTQSISSDQMKVSNSSPSQNVLENPPCLQRPALPLVIPVEATINGLKDPRPPPASVVSLEDSIILINVANWTDIIPSFSENPPETNLLTDATAVPVSSPDFIQQKTLPVSATTEPRAHRSDPAMQNYLKLVRLSTNNNPVSSPSLVTLSQNHLAQSQPRESPTENAVVQSKSGQSQVQNKAKSAFNSVVATYKKKLSLSTEVDLYSQ